MPLTSSIYLDTPNLTLTCVNRQTVSRSHSVVERQIPTTKIGIGVDSTTLGFNVGSINKLPTIVVTLADGCCHSRTGRINNEQHG